MHSRSHCSRRLRGQIFSENVNEFTSSPRKLTWGSEDGTARSANTNFLRKWWQSQGQQELDISKARTGHQGRCKQLGLEAADEEGRHKSESVDCDGEEVEEQNSRWTSGNEVAADAEA